jgi:hypothetical protein
MSKGPSIFLYGTVALLIAGIAGCGVGSAGDAPAAVSSIATADSPTRGATTPPPAPKAGSVPSSAAAAARPSRLSDGRWPGYIEGLSSSGTMSFDLIEFYQGAAATREWKKRNPGSSGGPPEDYFIVNDNTQERDLKIAPSATAVVFPDVKSNKTVEVSFRKLVGYLGNLSGEPPFWLTIRDGEVVKFEQQYLP